jgi:hypothetical protein
MESKSQSRITLLTMGSGFEMNDELAEFLKNTPELEVQVVTV